MLWYYVLISNIWINQRYDHLNISLTVFLDYFNLGKHYLYGLHYFIVLFNPLTAGAAYIRVFIFY